MAEAERVPPVNEAAANTEGDGSHQHDEHTGSAPSAQSSSTTLPQATDEKWTYEKQLQAALESRGLDSSTGLTLIWDHVSLRGVGGAADVRFAPDFGSMLMPWLAWSARKRSQALNRGSGHDRSMNWGEGDAEPKRGEPGLRRWERYLLRDFSGALLPGEMLLVLGRPGSGCSAFLKTLAGQTASYAGVEGGVHYGAVAPGSAAARRLAAEIIYVSEEEEHDANLLVGQTLDFAARMTVPAKAARPLDPNSDAGEPVSAAVFEEENKQHLLRALRVQATHDTKVGDQYVRGVSGGERKRITLLEAMAGGARIMCWDNPTRGLDANTAVLFARLCREAADVAHRTHAMTLYQAGNGIYEQFDKVCVIADGRVLFFGPRADARPYFERMGLVHADGANTADFLTAVTALNERQVAPGCEGRVPATAEEFAAAYQRSDAYRAMRAQIDALLADTGARRAETDAVQATVAAQKARHAFHALPQRRSYLAQAQATVVRDWQQRWGDQWSFWARMATTFVQAWIVGSVYYDVPDTTAGLYLRGGVLFVTIFYPVVLGLSELHAAFHDRGVLAKHKSYNLYRASTVILAKAVVDAPIFAVQNIVYVAICYWMAGLRANAGFFFTCFLFTWLVTMVFSTLFRSIGYAFNEFNDASKVAGTVFIFFVVYGGFVIYVPSMKPWFGWIRWINPLYYTFEAVVSNELTGMTLACAPPELVPYGPPYAGLPQGCSVVGNVPGSTAVSGSEYLRRALRMDRAHVWRNLGIIVALWALIAAAGMFFLEIIPASGSKQNVNLYKRSGGPHAGAKAPPADEEAGAVEKTPSTTSKTSQQSSSAEQLGGDGKQTTFTWSDVCYTVKTRAGADLQLLDHVSGFCRAGTITALMGSSGAGKTTLMDVLAARKSEGAIEGTVKLNGQSLPVSFQRTTGYCEQLDVHLPQATVREALEFSALLRQPRRFSDAQKLAYVDVIVDLLELGDIADAIIGEPGKGLGVEERRRLSIGVELVSRPALLFLDEPTSGLDGQSAFVVVGFLKKLAAAGQAILCTIHQPSAVLFREFDQLLLMVRGGRTVYFGAVAQLPAYFRAKGVEWPDDKNPAEEMIDIVSGDESMGRDWAAVWLESAERRRMLADIEQINATVRPAADDEDAYEYAATRWTQLRVVTRRACTQIYRNTDYTRNKMVLHAATGLISGFSWFKIGNSLADLQNRMFSLLMFVFIAPGVMVQTQPKFIKNRDIFEARERKSKSYCWQVFCFAEIVAEVPYLLLCAFIYFLCWYFPSGLDLSAGVAGPVYLQMTFYEFLYTGMGQFIAAYAPNPTFAAEVLPLFFGILIAFTGILVPYPMLPAFWRYWMYYLDPFQYLMQGLLTFPLWNAPVQCEPHEFGLFDPPPGLSCGQYLVPFMTYATGYVNNPDATAACEYCAYAKGSEYLGNMNITRKIDGWKGILITLLFCFSSYGLVFLLLKLRSRKTKTAKS